MVNMSIIEERRTKIYNKFKIDFTFLNYEYGLRRVPVDRPYIDDKYTLDTYCIKVRELEHNITSLEESGEDPYIALGARHHFQAVQGKDWEEKVSRKEDIIVNYNQRFLKVCEELESGKQDEES